MCIVVSAYLDSELYLTDTHLKRAEIYWHDLTLPRDDVLFKMLLKTIQELNHPKWWMLLNINSTEVPVFSEFSFVRRYRLRKSVKIRENRPVHKSRSLKHKHAQKFTISCRNSDTTTLRQEKPETIPKPWKIPSFFNLSLHMFRCTHTH